VHAIDVPASHSILSLSFEWPYLCNGSPDPLHPARNLTNSHGSLIYGILEYTHPDSAHSDFGALQIIYLLTYLVLLAGGIVIRRVCWLVDSLIRSLTSGQQLAGVRRQACGRMINIVVTLQTPGGGLRPSLIIFLIIYLQFNVQIVRYTEAASRPTWYKNNEVMNLCYFSCCQLGPTVIVSLVLTIERFSV